jgi:hypothetical protein
MRSAPVLSAFVPLLLSLALTAIPAGPGQAANGHSFIISAIDGYGVQDCLGESGDCGRIVADAWCEAHGHGAAISFGRAEDVTGVINVANSSDKTQTTPYVITCGE